MRSQFWGPQCKGVYITRHCTNIVINLLNHHTTGKEVKGRKWEEKKNHLIRMLLKRRSAKRCQNLTSKTIVDEKNYCQQYFFFFFHNANISTVLKISSQHPCSTPKYSALLTGSVWFSYSIHVDFVIILEYQIKYYNMFLLDTAGIDICRTMFWQDLYLIPKNHNFSEFFFWEEFGFFNSDSTWKQMLKCLRFPERENSYQL